MHALGPFPNPIEMPSFIVQRIVSNRLLILAINPKKSSLFARDKPALKQSSLHKTLLLSFLFALITTLGYAQGTATVFGRITDSQNKAIEGVNVAMLGTSIGTSTAQDGTYRLSFPSDSTFTLVFSHISFLPMKREIRLDDGEELKVNPTLRTKTQTFIEVVVEDEETRRSQFTRIDPKIINKLPSAGGNFEAVLFTLPGVSSNNELSSSYSVRGGNFDENLIYVNDIQVYRPFLVRSGQQEGLSFINSDLVSSILFSAGGFEARYGDKMSSVLDIQYKKPRDFGGGFSGSLLGGSLFLEDASKDHRFTQIHGLRYRSNAYVLGSLDSQGDYRPSFVDYQTYITFDLNDKLELAFMGNISRNKYQFIPQTRETDFGTINEALRLTVFFQGQEIDQYSTSLGALSLNWKPTSKLSLKFIGSSFITDEQETFDIEGAYRLDELERDLSSQEFGDVSFNRGVGGFIDHARNRLNAYVFNGEHLGTYKTENGSLQWGVKVQHEDIFDELSEWSYVDSAGFSVPQGIGIDSFYFYPEDTNQIAPIPYSPRDEINLREVIKAENTVISQRVMGFAQWNRSLNVGQGELEFKAGVRANYWTYNDEITLSPRASMIWDPGWETDIIFKAAFGYYHQPPFYREMRNLFGQLNPNISAQQSVHYVVGTDLNLRIWNRPFKFSGELYYKDLYHLIPYEIDNVRLRYYATNNSRGYGSGIDLKLNGEFVKGVDSWASLSIMQTRENLKDDFYYIRTNAAGDTIVPGFTFDPVAVDSTRIEPGFIPRPTDQLVNFGLYFQDYLPKLPTVQMQLSLLFGSGLPFGPPSYDRYRDTLRIPPYRRVDIGFSKQLLSEDRVKKESGPFRHFKEAFVTLEVFNLLDINNTISYQWIRDISAREYAIPNFLTTRRVNLRLVMRF